MSADDGACGHDSCGCQGNDPLMTPGEAESSILDRLDNESGFHPIGDEWEGEMREMLDDTEYDTELGMDMARDAMRLTAGEMSEEEFYEEYNEAIVEEFGEDERPMAAQFEPDEIEDGSIVDSIKELAGTDVSRRDTMKKGAFAAGAIGLGGILPRNEEPEDEATPSSPSGTAAAQDDGEDKQYGMVIDLDRCDGCLRCVVACMDEHNTSSGANWMYVLTWEDEDTEQDNFLVRPCQHCSNAPCAKVCPVMARHRRSSDGLVLTNYETCIGCRYCQVACPYGVNYFGWGEPEVPREELDMVDETGPELRDMSQAERSDLLEDSGDRVHDHRGWEVGSRPRIGTMGKCTFNVQRQDGNRGEELQDTTACMEGCDDQGMSAIHFGDLNDPDSRPNRYLERAKEMQVGPPELQEDNIDEDSDLHAPGPHPQSQLSAFRLLEEVGTEPNIIYLGNEPGPRSKQSEDMPVTYEEANFYVPNTHDLYGDVTVTDTRKDVTDESTDWGLLTGDD